jgi:hypothetical protein
MSPGKYDGPKRRKVRPDLQPPAKDVRFSPTAWLGNHRDPSRRSKRVRWEIGTVSWRVAWASFWRCSSGPRWLG